MAMRCLERISIAGNVYQLMQLNDFSVLNTKKWDDFAWTEQDNYPSYITSFGYNFRNIFTSEFITDGTSYSGYVDGTSCYFRQYRVYYSSSDAPNYVEIVIPNLPSGTPQIRQGYKEDTENLYIAIVVDDEEQEAYIIIVTNSSIWKKACLLYDTPSSRTKVAYQQLKNGFNIKFTANGGGATHIAKVTGQLSSLSNNLSDILMVSGGGGGGLIIGEDKYAGKEAGGISGSGDNSADQSTGNAFGQGESGTNVSGGGSGLYGGYKGTSNKSGGAGSGYIGNSLLSNKKMVGYNVPTSSAEGTKTESVNEVSESPVSEKPKSGNGFARIKFLREPTWDVVGTWIDGSTIYKKEFDFHNANGFGQEDEFILDLPECKHLFLGDSWMNVNPPNEDVGVFPFPYVTTTMSIVVGFLFGKDNTTNKPMFRLRRGSSTNVYDLYVTIRFILQ